MNDEPVCAQCLHFRKESEELVHLAGCEPQTIPTGLCPHGRRPGNMPVELARCDKPDGEPYPCDDFIRGIQCSLN